MNHGLPPEGWDQRLQQHGGGILQSRPWAQFQMALGREVVWTEGEGWQWLGVIRGSHGLRYLMSNYGPVADDAKTMASATKQLVAAGRALGVDFVRLEPQREITASQLKQLGARQIGEMDPQHTMVVDLKQSETALRGALASGHRNLINGTERRGITIRRSQERADLDLLIQMLDDTARHSNVTFYPAEYYKHLYDALAPDHLVLYLAEVKNKPVASALFYDWGDTRYYAHAGAFQEQNRRAKASVSLVWQALLDAKTAGRTSFDLWGTAPVGAEKHRLAGITKFKAAFGAIPVDYLGTWDIPLKSTKYRLYSQYRRMRGRS
jgi:hypothetical protein